MFVRYYLELPLAHARVEQTLVTLEDFLDQLGHAIVLSHLGPAARMPP